MKKTLSFKNQTLSYFLRKNWNSKNLRLTINSEGFLIVSAPRWLSVKKIENFILEKGEWILEKMKLAQKNHQEKTFWKKNSEEYLLLKPQARKIVRKKVKKYSQIYNFNYFKISIRDQKTRWGSCSKKGNLNFNYRIVFLPDHLIDYIVIHELCHLKEFNHSQNFWSLVKEILPDYKKRIQEIKKISQS